MNITTRFEKHKLAPRNYLSRTPHSKGTFIFDGCVTRTRWAWAGMNQLGGSVIHLTKMRLSDWRKIATFSEPPASFHPNSRKSQSFGNQETPRLHLKFFLLIYFQTFLSFSKKRCKGLSLVCQMLWIKNKSNFGDRRKTVSTMHVTVRITSEIKMIPEKHLQFWILFLAFSLFSWSQKFPKSFYVQRFAVGSLESFC